MTDARLPERWLNDRRLQHLPDGVFRSYINGLIYAVSNRLDGVIEPEDLPLIPRFAAGAAQLLVDAGLWSPRSPRGWLIADFAATQTSRSELEVLENARRRDREKKARQRAAKDGGSTGVTGDVPGDGFPGDSPGGSSPGTAQEGKDRQAGTRAPSEADNDKASFAVSHDPCLECQQRPAQGDPRPFPHLCKVCFEANKHPSMKGASAWHGAGPDPFVEYA